MFFLVNFPRSLIFVIIIVNYFKVINISTVIIISFQIPGLHFYLAAFLFAFFKLPFCLCFWYFCLILLEAKRNLFGSVIIFTFLGASIAIPLSDGIQMSSSRLIVSIIPVDVSFKLSRYFQINHLWYKYLQVLCCWRDYLYLIHCQLN